jgi:hypothetical protein
MDHMPRANRRRRDLDARPLASDSEVTSQVYAGRSWLVRRLTGASATREYRCPGCHQEISIGTPHVVVWPAEGLGGIDARRHWHSRCWQSRHATPPGHGTR